MPSSTSARRTGRAGRGGRRAGLAGWVERSDTHHGVASLLEHAGMTGYRRNFVAGGSFFFTVNLAERRLGLLTQHIDELRSAFRETRRHHPFTIDAVVAVPPDHLHTVWTLPDADADFAMRWRLIKSAFSRRLPTGERISDSRAAKGERGIWQRRYWEHTIRDENDFRASYRLHPYQPGQAWAGAAGQGLAVFVVPSYGETRNLSRGLGRRCLRSCRAFWRAAMTAAAGGFDVRDFGAWDHQ
jgi:REP element-mobilizing transposase RayT